MGGGEEEGRGGGEAEVCYLFVFVNCKPELFSKCQMVSEECYLNEVNLTFSRERETRMVSGEGSKGEVSVKHLKYFVCSLEWSQCML